MSEILDMKAAAQYVGLNYFTFREYVEQGLVASIRYPSLGHHNQKRPQKRKGTPRRKRLFLKTDLDAFMQRFREGGEVETGATTGTRNGVPRATNYQKGWQNDLRLKLAR